MTTEWGKLLNIVGMSGGEIRYLKKLKYMANLLSFDENPYINYYWGRRFFGPYNRSLNKDISIATSNGYLEHKNFTTTDNILEPVHNIFSLTDKGRKKVFSELRREMKENAEYVYSLIGRCITYNLLPVGADLCLTFKRMGKEEKETSIPFSKSVMNLDIEIKEDFLKDYIEFLKERRIESSELLKEEINGTLFFSTKLKIQPSIARKRYGYLQLTKKNISKSKIKYDEFKKSSNKKSFIAKEIGVAKVDAIEKYPESVDYVEREWSNCLEEIEKVDNPNRYWDNIMRFLEELYEKTVADPFELIFYKEGRIILSPSSILLRFISSRGYGCYDQLWHTLDPIRIGPQVEAGVFYDIRDV